MYPKIYSAAPKYQQKIYLLLSRDPYRRLSLGRQGIVGIFHRTKPAFPVQAGWPWKSGSTLFPGTGRQTGFVHLCGEHSGWNASSLKLFRHCRQQIPPVCRLQRSKGCQARKLSMKLSPPKMSIVTTPRAFISNILNIPPTCTKYL